MMFYSGNHLLISVDMIKYRVPGYANRRPVLSTCSTLDLVFRHTRVLFLTMACNVQKTAYLVLSINIIVKAGENI